MPSEKLILFLWGVSSYFGWGVYGLNLLLAWAERTDLLAASLQPIDPAQLDLDPLERRLLTPALREAGAPRVELVLQGVDASHFHPAPRRGLFPGRFVVFSGGKLEYRKGQDLVLQAFRIFAQHRPDALLLTAWSSPWPEIARTLAANPDLVPPSFRADGTVDVLA